MHMSDALLSPAVGTTFWATALGVMGYCARKLRENADEKLIPLMGALGAFIFAAQMINFTIPGTGSSGHLGGGMILAIILGPYAGFIVIASVLTIQSLFFADGGILALGCNIWNLGFFPCFVAYPFVYRPFVKKGITSKRILIASVISVIAGLQLGALSVISQTVFSGKSEIPFTAFALVMLPIHLVIALIEGFITAGVINYVRIARPEIIGGISSSGSPAHGISFRNIVISFLVISLIAGGLVSLFASSNPDGLEWSFKKIYGESQLPEKNAGHLPFIKKIQDKTAFLPDYNFREAEKKSGTTVSGIVGSVMVLCLIFIIGIVIKFIRKNSRHS